MNRIFFFILLAILLTLASCTQTPEESLAAEPEPLFFGDPYVLVDDGHYYMYGTGRDSDTGIAVYKSDNLETWAAEIEEDFSSVRLETMKKMISRSQDWEESPALYQNF